MFVNSFMVHQHMKATHVTKFDKLIMCVYKKNHISSNKTIWGHRKSSHPVSDFWHNSSCSSKWGKSCPRVSSPTQQLITFGVSCALFMILIHDLSMLENLFASCNKWMKIVWRLLKYYNVSRNEKIVLT